MSGLAIGKAKALFRSLEPVLDLVYPPRCCVCDFGSMSPLCDNCIAAIAPVTQPLCDRCGQSIAATGDCSHCETRPPAFEGAAALGDYTGVLEQAIHRMKYRDMPQLAEPLGIALAEMLKNDAELFDGATIDVVIPVPMSPARCRLRGYNQAQRVARVVARECSLPLDIKSLARSGNVRPQVGLTGAERRKNIAGAFMAVCSEAVVDKAVLLIDDVSTTGSTLHECAKALKEAGAKAVYALTLAAG